MHEKNKIISKAFANFGLLRDKRMRHYKGILSVLMMKIRFRCRLRRYGEYGIIKGNYLDSLNENRVRYVFLVWGLCVGLPVELPKPVDWRSLLRKQKTMEPNRYSYRQIEEYVYHSVYEQRVIMSVMKAFFEDALIIK